MAQKKLEVFEFFIGRHKRITFVEAGSAKVTLP